MLKNKVAVVTGGTRGIGFATVEKFLENNAKVILLGSKKESVDKALSKLKEKGYIPTTKDGYVIKKVMKLMDFILH